MREKFKRRPYTTCWIVGTITCSDGRCVNCHKVVKNVTEYCDICRVKLAEHPYCHWCSISIGSGHVEEKYADDDLMVCSDCLRRGLPGKLRHLTPKSTKEQIRRYKERLEVIRKYNRLKMKANTPVCSR